MVQKEAAAYQNGKGESVLLAYQVSLAQGQSQSVNTGTYGRESVLKHSLSLIIISNQKNHEKNIRSVEIKDMPNKSLYEIQMRNLLREAGIEFVEEYQFLKSRKWRFDFVLKPVKTKIAIEVNGGIWIKGRHNFGKSYEKDLEKINTAQMMGWTVLQYTRDTLPKVLKDLEILKIINNNNHERNYIICL